jgi:hypothetical protein
MGHSVFLLLLLLFLVFGVLLCFWFCRGAGATLGMNNVRACLSHEQYASVCRMSNVRACLSHEQYVYVCRMGNVRACLSDS